MIIALLGAEHEALDVVAEAALDEATALALTRGRFPKGYASVDPNEDAALAADGPSGRLLAVADGHNGVEASHAAIGAVAAHAERALDGTRPAAEVLEDLFGAAIAATRTAVDGLGPPRDRSRTALSLALLAPGEVHAATLGDTAVVVVQGGKVRALGAPGRFLGPSSRVPRAERARVRDGDVVVACSDGVVDFLPAGGDAAIAQVVAVTGSATETAARLVATAMAGGAGDNVTAAVADATGPVRRWGRRRGRA